MSLNTGITHCIDCGQDLSAEQMKRKRARFHIPRCRQCYQTKMANYCQYYYKTGKRCKDKADYGEDYCPYHLDLPIHLRSKYKPKFSSEHTYQNNRPQQETGGRQQRHSKSNSKRSSHSYSVTEPTIGEPETIFHRLLGVTFVSTAQEIRKAYIQRARELHPDKNTGIDTTSQFQELQHAYDIVVELHNTFSI